VDELFVLKMAKTESKGSGSRGSKGSKGSEKQSWKVLSMSRRSVGRVHSSFSLHTRLASVLAEERQDAFDPSSTMAKVWDQILLSCLLLEAFLVPFVLAFQPVLVESVSALYVVVLGCEAVFVADLYVQAHTGYYSDGNLIQDKKRTIRRYIRSRQFALDIAAVLPCQLLVVVYPHVVAKVLFLKLLRWSRFPQLVSSLDEFYAKHFVPLKLFKVLASTLYLAHVLACVRYSFGDDDDHSNEWLPDTAAHSPSLSRHYLMSLFWSVGIMTGLYEGELPRHSSELLFTILVALCGFAMFTTLCATIFVISKCESGNTEAMEARINQLVHVLSFHRVPESQQAQAVEYLKVRINYPGIYHVNLPSFLRVLALLHRHGIHRSRDRQALVSVDSQRHPGGTSQVNYRSGLVVSRLHGPVYRGHDELAGAHFGPSADNPVFSGRLRRRNVRRPLGRARHRCQLCDSAGDSKGLVLRRGLRFLLHSSHGNCRVKHILDPVQAVAFLLRAGATRLPRLCRCNFKPFRRDSETARQQRP
jgi:hypothetical protein